MAATESPVVHELNNLNALIGKLSAEQKAKENIIKDLNEQVKMAEARTVLKIKEAEAAFETRKRELEALLAPLEHLKHQVGVHEQLLVSKKQALHDETAAMKHARQLELTNLADQVVVQAARLDRIQQEITRCKSNVSEL